MVRFSKTIQRAIPQKIRRSASMLKCETTPFCYTPKYATIVLRSSRATHTFNITTINTTDTTTRKVVFIIYINTFASDMEHFICQIHAPLFLLSQLHTVTTYFLVTIIIYVLSKQKTVTTN